MRFVGQTEIYSFLAAWPEHGDTLRAWTSEIKYRWWKSAMELAADFQDIDSSRIPVVIFYLAPTGLRVETLIDFRLGIVLLTGFQRPAVMTARAPKIWNARHDNYAHSHRR